jgi:purine-binding chemotaxis protein CheW
MSHAPPEEPGVEEAPEIPTESLLVVRAAGRPFALPISEVHEVVPELPLTPIPGAGDAVCGMVNVRGRVLAVVDLGRSLGADPGPGAGDRRLLVVEQGGRLAALRVDDVVRIERVPVDELEAVRGGTSEVPGIRGGLTMEIGTVDLLDAERVLELELG